MDCQNPWGCREIFFPKNFLNFWSDTIEKQGIINFIMYSSNSYASVFVVVPRFPFLGEEKEAIFHTFLCCIVYRLCCISSLRNFREYFTL